MYKKHIYLNPDFFLTTQESFNLETLKCMQTLTQAVILNHFID